MTGAALRLTDVACVRGGRMLFRGIDLALAPGGGALLTGPNGVGKSSLLRICAGLLPAFAGTVERSGGIALADERLALDTDLSLASDRSVSRALDFWAKLDRAGPDAVAVACEAMALSPLAITRASIWLLDEPGNGLDSPSLDLLGRAVATHLAAGGIVIAASHQPLPIDAPLTLALADYRADAA